VKPWYWSKTIWFNIATGLLAAGVELAPLVEFMEPDAQSEARFWLAMFVALGNIILRTLTAKPVSAFSTASSRVD